VTTARIAILAAIAVLGVSCRSSLPPSAIDPSLAAQVPSAATILAGVNLERIRNSPIGSKLPPIVSQFLDAWKEARTALVASDGANYLVLSPGRPAMGVPDWVRAAVSPHGPTNPLLPRAEPLAADSDIWIVAAGSANLPLTGNGENLARLVHTTEYTTLRVKLADEIAIEIAGVCGSDQIARQLGEQLRGFLMLGTAAAGRQPALSALLKRIHVTREDRVVHVKLTASPAELGTML
jgi:hypothetical protein